MTRGLKTTFLVHAIVAVLSGLLMWLIPGRFLLLVGWPAIDPIASRLYGAALLAVAWSSFRGWQASEWSQVSILVEMEVALTVLGCVALLNHVVRGGYPTFGWLVLAVLAAFAVAWIYFLWRGRE
jgi:hypothetical protein